VCGDCRPGSGKGFTRLLRAQPIRLVHTQRRLNNNNNNKNNDKGPLLEAGQATANPARAG
jgi:hypothetical protein